MKKFVLIALLSVFSAGLFGQSHMSSGDYKCSLVAASMKKGTEGVRCPACAKKDDAGRKAKLEKEKLAKTATESENASMKQKAQSNLKNSQKVSSASQKSSQVVINANRKTEKVSKPKTIVVTADKSVLIGKNSKYSSAEKDPVEYFENEKGERIMQDESWSLAADITHISYTKTSITNIGMIRVGDKNYYYQNDKHPFYCNLINSKQEHLLPDGEISSIAHIKDNWFAVLNHDKTCYVINMATKKKHNLPNYLSDNAVNFIGIDFIPMFSEDTQLNMDNYGEYDPRTLDFYKRGYIRSGLVTEELLKKYSFVLLHGSTDPSYVAKDYEKNIGSYRKLVLYCIDRQGNFSTIDLL